MNKKPLILIGAGGHAKVVADALASQNKKFVAYVDPTPAPWLEARGVKQITEEKLQKMLHKKPQLVIGFVGLTIEALERRIQIMQHYSSNGATFPAIVDASAIIGSGVTLEAGAHVLAASVINGYATIKQGAVINTGSIIEHDALVGAGTHIAPRAVVLGAAKVGDCCVVGSNAVIIQGVVVPSKTIVKALHFFR